MLGTADFNDRRTWQNKICEDRNRCNRDPMKTTKMLLVFLTRLPIPLFALDTAKIEQVTGLKGALDQQGNVYNQETNRMRIQEFIRRTSMYQILLRPVSYTLV